MVAPIQPNISLDPKKKIRPQWRLISILVIMTFLTGCYVLLNHFVANQQQFVTIVDPGKTVDPETTGGKKLPGTEDMRIYGDDNFSISPNGRWLLYYSDAAGTRDLFFVLYDITNQKANEISLNSNAKEWAEQYGGPSANIGCWDTDSKRVYIPNLFYIDVTSSPFEMEVDETADTEARKYYLDCPQLALQKAKQEAHTVVRTVRHSSHQFDLVDARNPEKILVRHKSRTVEYTVHLGHVSISPSGTHIAYVVLGGSGGWANPSRGYVLDLTSKNASPQLLGATVYGPIRWSPDSTTIYASVDDNNGDTAIYQWDVRTFK